MRMCQETHVLVTTSKALVTRSDALVTTSVALVTTSILLLSLEKRFFWDILVTAPFPFFRLLRVATQHEGREGAFGPNPKSLFSSSKHWMIVIKD